MARKDVFKGEVITPLISELTEATETIRTDADESASMMGALEEVADQANYSLQQMKEFSKQKSLNWRLRAWTRTLQR
jgi:methyl-accepting chemotaxis protein